MKTPKHYSEKVWDDMFQMLHESIYDGVRMLKMLQKEVLRLDSVYSGTSYDDWKFVRGHLVEKDGKQTYEFYETIHEENIKPTLPSFRDVFIHDMLQFIENWKRRCSSVGVEYGSSSAFNRVDKSVMNKILENPLYDDFSHVFENVEEYMYTAMTQEDIDVIHNRLACVVKAVVQTSRRIVGLDVGGRYKDAYVVYTMFGMGHPGEEPNLKLRTYLVDKETAMRMYDGAQMFKPTIFKQLS